MDVEQLAADCRAALAGEHSARNVRDVVARAVADPAALIKALGSPSGGGLTALYRSPDLTVLDVRWQPNMVLMPHDHSMWAVIGIYSGREDNILWRRADGGRIEAAGAKSLGSGEVIAFGADVVHSVINPLARVTGAIHVYGGDFFATPRSQWEPETLTERPLDIEGVLRQFQS